ncbi:GNAT family N-acetyltransferase [Clostridiaceae bacterium]|nr:GNAT family N-acetyltransferase [Clostridiaceae bacterium]RKI18407.1 GNAT family N-acetyltransferase [bacterium 1XD21-70]
MDIIIRQVMPEDLDAVARVEAICFPQAEAASRASFAKRIQAFPESFFVAERQGEIVGFINGCVTDSRVICDEMFEDVRHHRPDGAYQSIFGLDVVPQLRRQGLAAQLMGHMVRETQKRGKKGLILTCKDRLIGFYERFGYQNLGISGSVHGGAVWYDMILEFDSCPCMEEREGGHGKENS